MLVAKAFSDQAASSKSIRRTEAYSGDVGVPPVGGLLGFKFSSRRHPRKFGVKRFLVVREVAGAVSGVACFWATSLEDIIGGVIAIISFRPGGWMQQSAVPRCAILSVRSGRPGSIKNHANGEPVSSQCRSALLVSPAINGLHALNVDGCLIYEQGPIDFVGR